MAVLRDPESVFMPDYSRGGKLRRYGFYDGGGSLFIINDGITPYMAMLARTFPKELTRALGSIGYETKRELQAIMKAGSGPAGTAWKPLSESVWLQFSRYEGRQKKLGLSERGKMGTGALFGKLTRAVGYKREKDLMRVRIGFLSLSAAKLMMNLQQGFQTDVSSALRRKFNTGALQGAGDEIKTPARPLIAPHYRNIEGGLARRIEDKISGYLAGSSGLFQHMGM